MRSKAPSDDQVGTKPARGDAGFMRRVIRFVTGHPYMTGIVVASTIGGAVVGGLVPFGDFGVGRRVVGGAIVGFYFSLFPLGFRLLER